MGSRPRKNAPLSSARQGVSPILVAIVLVVLGASMAFAVERFVPLNGASPTASPSDTSGDGALVSDDPNADASSDPAADASDEPIPSESPAAPLLQAALPTSVNGTALTAQSALGSAMLGADPSSRALGASITTLGHKTDDLQVAYAYDETGTLDLSVLGFRIDGLDPKKLEPVILDAWLSANAAGVKTTAATVSGVALKEVVYGDDGATEYVFIKGDSVFVIETTDAALAAATIAAMPKQDAVGSPASPVASPVASPAASPSGS